MNDLPEPRYAGRDVSRTGTNSPRSRKLNESLVLDLVRRNGVCSRPWIAEQLELEFQTVSNITGRLIETGLLLDAGLVEGVKRKSRGVVVNPSAAYALGVEINRAEANVALVGLDGGIVDSTQLPVAERRVEEVLEEIVQACRSLTRTCISDGISPVGVGVSVPGPIDRGLGSILEPPNFRAWHGVRVGPMLAEELGLPSWVNTTATSAALGAQWAAASGAYENFIYVYLGGGVGLGAISNGRPLRGAQGNAGEFAHLVADVDGPECMCGQRGCLVQYATPQGLLAAIQGAWVEESRRVPAMSMPMPSSFEAALDPDAPEWMARTLKHSLSIVARAVTRMVVTLDPEAVIFGGPTAGAIGAGLIEEMYAAWGQTPTFGRSAPALLTADNAELAGALGAASLPLHNLFSPRPLH